MGVNLAGVSFFQNLVYLVIVILGCWMVVHYCFRVKEEKRELKKLVAFADFLDAVCYQYTIYQSVEEAVLEGLDNVAEEIRETVEDIYSFLLQEEEEELRTCKEKYEQSFYYQFLIYSYLAIRYGDNLEDSMYLKNLVFLKKQIFAWKLDRENLIHYLQGLTYLVIVPVQCLKFIEIWAQFNLSELSKYYDYGYGIVTRFVLILITVFCYQIILGLRSTYVVHYHSSKLLDGLSRKVVVEKCYLLWAEHHPQRVRRLTLLLRRYSSRITVEELFLIRITAAGMTFVLSMVFLAPILNEDKCYVLCFIGVIMFLTIMMYFVPVWYLALGVRLMKKEKEDEVYFFYAITQMVADVGGGDIDQVLEWLELSGNIFVPTLQECIDEYAFDNEFSLDHAVQLEPFSPFIKLINALKMSELVGLKQAVYPLQIEKEHFIEKRKQDNLIATENKGVLGRFIAFLPMFCVIGLYLILPFVLESIVQLQGYVERIQTGL